MWFIDYKNVGAKLRQCNNTDLHYDQACLQVVATNQPLYFWSQYTECEGCTLQRAGAIEDNNATEFRMESLWPAIYEIRSQDDILCNGTYHFREYGQYKINSTESCKVIMVAEPDAAYLPLLEAAVTLLAIATCWYLIKAFGKRILTWRILDRFVNREDNELGSDTRALTSEGLNRTPRSPTRSRLRSLDVFRGAAVALMIFVNVGGGGYREFRHAVWNGLHIADVVFPCFAWLMGASLVLSLNARLRTAMSRLTAFRQVAWRSLTLALVGLLLTSSGASVWDVRLPGVLQRLAAMYLIIGGIECLFMKTSQGLVPGASLVRDLRAGWRQWTVTGTLVGIHLCITLLAAAPGCPRGYTGPGGLHMAGQYANCTGGVAGFLDREILGASHLYRGGTFRKLYGSETAFDPEGLLGVLSGVLVVQAGAHAARIMLAFHHARARIMRWMLWAILMGLLAGALCIFTQNMGPIPINKNLWSLSYCLATSAIAFFIQALLYFFIDLKKCWGGRPFYYAGQNSLIIYIGSELLKKHFPLHWPLAAPTHSQLLATHAATVLMWLAIAVALQRKRVFISL